MSHFRQFKPRAELCQAKTSIYGKLSHAKAANYAALADRIMEKCLLTY